MRFRRSEFDVTNRVDITNPDAVKKEVCTIYQDLFPDASTLVLERSFRDVASLYRGTYPGFLNCDTWYHDIQHILDVTLAMARLMDGYERSRRGTDPLGDELFRFGILLALLHDCGYIRTRKDSRHRNGAEYTKRHVSRGAKFVRRYFPKIGMGHLAPVASKVIHFTGYEIPVEDIRVPSFIFRLIGNLLGSADIIAQMADRCYLEKCRDRLYPEFVLGGIARKHKPDGTEEVLFASAEDLVFKTPGFYKGASQRLNEKLGAVYKYAETHFGGQNLYLDEVDRNIRFAEKLAAAGTAALLKRSPPQTIVPELFPQSLEELRPDPPGQAQSNTLERQGV